MSPKRKKAIASLAAGNIGASKKKVLACLIRKESRSITDVMIRLGGDRDAQALRLRVRAILSLLVEEGQVVRVGRTRWTSYRRR